MAGELAAVFGEQHLSAPVVETLGRAGRELRRLDDQLGPEDLRGAVDQNLRIIGRLLRAAGPDRLHARLSGVAAEHAQLAGWLAFDSCDQQAARRHLRGALRAALAAADSDLAGYVLGWMGVVVMPSDARQGLDLAVQAQCQASSDAPPAVAAWLRRVEAEARARLGQERECMQALNEARRAVSRGRTRPNPPWMYFLDEAQLTAYAGLCYLRLRRPGQAKGLLERAVSDLATAFTRDRCLYLSYLADAHALANEPEQAVRFGRQSLSIATSTGSPRSIRRLYAIASRLDPRAGPREVAQFREELITCLP